jgi:mRNA-degrading endonuclease YafQ of YafQ-DinJ toxin-antitoxin module
MSYILIFTDSYIKRAKRFARQHPELKEQYRKTLLLLAQNPYHPSLRLHPLKGKLATLRQIGNFAFGIDQY